MALVVQGMDRLANEHLSRLGEYRHHPRFPLKNPFSAT